MNRDRDRKRRRSTSLDQESPPYIRKNKASVDYEKQRVEEDDPTASASKGAKEKKKQPKGTKLFKQQPSKDDDRRRSNANLNSAKAATGSVEYWNDERAKLGLKPLKSK